MLTLLCSGQGHQSANMFDCFAGSSEAEPVFAAASQVLGIDPRALVTRLTVDDLHRNRLSQVLCVTQALAAYHCLRNYVHTPLIVAGYSVGEMAAWSIAGAWTIQQTLALTDQRAACMDVAGGPDDSLGYIRGLAYETVVTLCNETHCAVAIVNPENLIIIGGDRVCVQDACTRARQIGASHAKTIAVHIASHTPKLQAAVLPFEMMLKATPTHPPTADARLVTASTARTVYDFSTARAGLAAQLAETIHWDRTLDALAEYGATQVLELGPGTALVDMMQKPYPLIPARALSDFATLDGARRWILP